MGRNSKLTENQWVTIEARLAAGELAGALAKEYKIDRSNITRRLSQGVRNIKEVANQLVAADVALKSLNLSQQIAAINLADELKAISGHLASAGKYGAMTANKLSAMANAQSEKINTDDPMSSADVLNGIGGLTKMANSASEIAINLLRANREFVDGINSGDVSAMSEEEIRAELDSLG